MFSRSLAEKAAGPAPSLSVRPKPSTPFQKLPRFWIVPIPLPRKGQPRSHIRGRSGDAPHRPRCQPCVPLPPRYRHGISICSVRLQGRVAVEQAARTMSKQRLQQGARAPELGVPVRNRCCVRWVRKGQKKKTQRAARKELVFHGERVLKSQQDTRSRSCTKTILPDASWIPARCRFKSRARSFPF